MKGHIKYISQRLSLRKPQNEALNVLALFFDQIGLLQNKTADFELLNKEFPHLKSFERDFPNVCFSLATGVGKTRLMGAMISYLVLAKRIRNFLIFAPNNTILEKLVKDFSDHTSEKYVFNGIKEFTARKPKIVTSENYSQGYGVKIDRAIQGDLFADEEDVHINIFNIAKMHADKRKIKEKNDYLEVSYFDYLASLEDLVVLMDEAHQYRADAAMKTVQELKPLLGLEFTATPHLSGGLIKFKNILYDYPLSAALKDGFLKEPAVAGRENFNKNAFSSDEELERLKIEDGVRLHEQTKLHLQTYAEETGSKLIKPLMLVVAENIKHANEIQGMIESDDFFEGFYREKVLVVHSELKTEAEEKMIRNLLEVESSINPIEIVIHVNKLREGWDIVNLYTMVPLRAANSKILIEQNLGRGLRLPYGKKVDKVEIDTHTIVSHDRFNEIIDAANRDSSPIRKGILIGKDVPLETLEIVEVSSNQRLEIEKISSDIKREMTLKVFDAVHLHGIETKEDLIKHVQKNVIDNDGLNLDLLVDDFLNNQKKTGISVPKINIQPKAVRDGKFLKFPLDVTHISVKPFNEGIIVQSLIDDKRVVYETNQLLPKETSVKDYLIKQLLDFDDVAENEENNEVVVDCVDQMIDHLKSYLKDELAVNQVVNQQGKHLAKIIHSQMINHYEEPLVEWDETISEKMLHLGNRKFLRPKGSQLKHFSKCVDDKINIREMIFEGFQKSLYPLVKFDSDSERVFSVILEQDNSVSKWLKPHKGVFSFISYSKDACYEPDFVVETEDQMYLVEIKRRSEMESSEILAKAKAAFHWCKVASQQAKKNQLKPWIYLLIPHDAVNLCMTLQGLATSYVYNYPEVK